MVNLSLKYEFAKLFRLSMRNLHVDVVVITLIVKHKFVYLFFVPKLKIVNQGYTTSRKIFFLLAQPKVKK